MAVPAGVIDLSLTNGTPPLASPADRFSYSARASNCRNTGRDIPDRRCPAGTAFDIGLRRTAADGSTALDAEGLSRLSVRAARHMTGSSLETVCVRDLVPAERHRAQLERMTEVPWPRASVRHS